MSKKEIIQRLFITFVWFLGLSLLRWQWHWDLIFLWLGGLVGSFLLEFDHLLYVLVTYPQELTSMRIKRLFQERRPKDALVLLEDTREERTRLAFHNGLFQVIFFLFSFFVISSTEGLLGVGLVLAINLHLVREEIGLLLQGKEEYLRQLLFWPIKREVSFRQQKFFVILMILLFLGLNLLLI